MLYTLNKDAELVHTEDVSYWQSWVTTESNVLLGMEEGRVGNRYFRVLAEFLGMNYAGITAEGDRFWAIRFYDCSTSNSPAPTYVDYAADYEMAARMFTTAVENSLQRPAKILLGPLAGGEPVSADLVKVPKPKRSTKRKVRIIDRRN